MPKPSPQALASARGWCSDALHDILGFADSALAGFLVDVASRGGGGNGNAEKVVQTMRDGGVECDEGRLRSFAAELCGRCSAAGGSGGASSAGGQAKSRPTNADMMRKAAGYGLVDMDDGAPPARKSGSSAPRKREKSRAAEEKGDGGSVPGTVITRDSSKDSRKKKKKRRDDEGDDDRKRPPPDRDDPGGRENKSRRESRRRRRRSSSSSSSGGSAVVDEDALWEAREARREEIRRKRKGAKDDGEKKKEGKEVDESKLTPEERAAIERERDIRERDEFAKRLSAKDKRKQSSKIDDDEDEGGEGGGKEGAAARMERLRKLEDRTRRLARGESVELDDSDDEDGEGGDEAESKQKKSISIGDMRAESKRAYLQKRTKRELELLERELEDEEDLIARVGGAHTLTAEEKRELELKRDILRMAREHGHVGDEEREADGYYRLPDEFDDDKDERKRGKSRAQRGEELLTGRYVEVAAEKTEQQLWEEGQSQMAAGEFILAGRGFAWSL